MDFHIVTIFPEFFDSLLSYGVVGRAMAAGLFRVQIHDLRNWTYDRHRTVDDRPFGGGAGMLLKPAPLFEAVEAILPQRGAGQQVILLSAGGKKFSQELARKLAAAQDLVILCGRYDGVDERVAENLVDAEISIGDFVLSGGELGAALIMDAVGRLLPGVLGNEESSRNESFGEENNGLLDCPQYTRPAEFRGWKVPEVLLGGNHSEIERWRRAASHAKTERVRPDLMECRTDRQNKDHAERSC